MYYKYLAGGLVDFSSTPAMGSYLDCVWVVTKHSAFNWSHIWLRNFTAGKGVLHFIDISLSVTETEILSFSSTVSLEVVKMTTSGASYNENFGKKDIFGSVVFY